MLHFLSRMVAIVVIGMMWGCGKDSVVVDAKSQTGEHQAGKVTAQEATHAKVVLTLKHNGSPVRDAVIEFMRPAGATHDDFVVLARTDILGQASFVFWTSDTPGHYQARAWDSDGERIGSWVNIPITIGYKIMVDLPTGNNATVTDKSPLTVIRHRPEDRSAPHAATEGSG